MGLYIYRVDCVIGIMQLLCRYVRFSHFLLGVIQPAIISEIEYMSNKRSAELAFLGNAQG
jgi:hypothetical protein